MYTSLIIEIVRIGARSSCGSGLYADLETAGVAGTRVHGRMWEPGAGWQWTSSPLSPMVKSHRRQGERGGKKGEWEGIVLTPVRGIL